MFIENGPILYVYCSGLCMISSLVKPVATKLFTRSDPGRDFPSTFPSRVSSVPNVPFGTLLFTSSATAEGGQPCFSRLPPRPGPSALLVQCAAARISTQARVAIVPPLARALDSRWQLASISVVSAPSTRPASAARSRRLTLSAPPSWTRSPLCLPASLTRKWISASSFVFPCPCPCPCPCHSLPWKTTTRLVWQVHGLP